MPYQGVIDKHKKQYKVKNDTKFKMKLGVSFDDLAVYDAKYHLKCFKTLWETANLTKPVQCNQYYFKLDLPNWSTPEWSMIPFNGEP